MIMQINGRREDCTVVGQQGRKPRDLITIGHLAPVALDALQADHVGRSDGSGDACQVNDLVLTLAPLNIVRHALHECPRLKTLADLFEPSSGLHALHTETWTANDTATEWTLTLQPGVTLHDDSTFDAADVKFTLERIKDPALESPVTDVLGFIDGVDIVDPLTARIRLSTPHAGLPLLLMDYRVRILPEGAAEPFGIGLPP